MKEKSLKDRLSFFWILQIFGWAGYALDRFLSERVFFPVFFIYILMAFSLTLALRPIYRWLWSKSPRVLTVGLTVLLCSIVAGFLWLVLSDVIFILLKIRKFPDLSFGDYLLSTARYSLTHHKPFLFLSWGALYFGIKYWQDVQRQEERALRASALAKEAQLQMLRYQLNPHFLFNALNSASALIREDAPRAEKMIGQLSEFLRYSLVGAKTKAIPLREELEAARNYLDVEKVRYEDKLVIHFDISPGAQDFPVPSLLIHPLIENAVKYGMQTSPLPLSIDVQARMSGDTLQLEVSNTGHWIEPKQNGYHPSAYGAGIGLQNVRERLQQAFPQAHTFEVGGRNGRVQALMEMTRNGKVNE
jgi:two-component system, LytTR family, sensor kinase